MTIGIGDRFPPVEVRTAEGPVDLSQRWSKSPLVIAFHRMWCPFCQQAAIQLSDAASDVELVGGGVVIVYREDPDSVVKACLERRTAALCVSDADRSLERAVELDRFTLSRYGAFSPRRLLQARRAGAHIGGVGSNVLQGRGTFVVNRSGRVVYRHEATTAADIPPIGEIVTAVRRAARG